MESYTPPPHSSSNLARWALVFGIVIVLNMFFNYALSLVYTEPKFDDYMVPPQRAAAIQTREACLGVGGQWSESVAPAPAKGQGAITTGFCDPDFTNRQKYDAAHNAYQRSVFIILAILGIMSLITGVMVGQAILTPALAWGGILSLLIACMRYWSAAGSIVKVIILALALAGLIAVAVKKFGK